MVQVEDESLISTKMEILILLIRQIGRTSVMSRKTYGIFYSKFKKAKSQLNIIYR